MENLKRTPLYDRHVRLNARMASFGGWEMPIQYSGIIEEYEACRKHIAMFDTCHMGVFYFRGDMSSSGFDSAFTLVPSKVPAGRCKYGFLLQPDGGIIDDLVVYRVSGEEALVIVNAGTMEQDFAAIGERLTDAVWENRSGALAKLDVQGPGSREVIAALFGDKIRELKYFTFTSAVYDGDDVWVSRTGYTGELGYEIYLPAAKIGSLWDKLREHHQVKPAGLGARDVLRLEMGYLLSGSDISPEINPLEAGQEIFVDWEHDFVGKQALETVKRNGLSRIRVGFKTLSRRSPRHGYELYVGETQRGVVTSGTFSPALNCGVGMGYIEAGYENTGSPLRIAAGQAFIDAEIAEMPFYREGTARK